MGSPAVDYEGAMAVARSDDVNARLGLATNPQTPPEFLYFLAENPDVGVRRAIGENPSTPNKADVLLSRDADISVRCAVARKIVGDGLDPQKRQDLWRMGFTILETLMRDNVVKVRKILSQAFRSDPQAPHPLVVALARDKEEEIAAPVLRESPVLSDDDMVTIIQEGVPGWAQQAIAGRDTVSPSVSDALIENGDPASVATMVANAGSEMVPAALEDLVDRSRTVTELQPPLVERKGLSGGLLVKLAQFVAGPLLKKLCSRDDIDEATAASMNTVIESRADQPEQRAAATAVQTDCGPGAAQGSAPDAPRRRPQRAETAQGRARRLFEEGRLTDEAVAQALDNWDNGFVTEALVLRSGLSGDLVERMIKVQNARTMVALSWKAGFTARFAMDLQRQLAGIAPHKIMNARDGIDYPMSTTDMDEQLALFD